MTEKIQFQLLTLKKWPLRPRLHENHDQCNKEENWHNPSNWLHATSYQPLSRVWASFGTSKAKHSSDSDCRQSTGVPAVLQSIYEQSPQPSQTGATQLWPPVKTPQWQLLRMPVGGSDTPEGSEAREE